MRKYVEQKAPGRMKSKSCGCLEPLGPGPYAGGSCLSSWSPSSSMALPAPRGENGKVRGALIRHTAGAKAGRQRQLPF